LQGLVISNFYFLTHAMPAIQLMFNKILAIVIIVALDAALLLSRRYCCF
jgi:hypothetical protein